MLSNLPLNVLADFPMYSSSQSSLLHLPANISFQLLFGPYPLVLQGCSSVLYFLWHMFGWHTYCRCSQYFHTGLVCRNINISLGSVGWFYIVAVIDGVRLPSLDILIFHSVQKVGYLHFIRTTFRYCFSVFRRGKLCQNYQGNPYL